MRTRKNVTALTWGNTDILEEYLNAGTRPYRERIDFRNNETPLAKVMRDIVDFSDKATGYGGPTLTSYSNIVFLLDNALTLKPPKWLRDLISAQTAQIEQEPHLTAIQRIKEATGYKQQRIAQLLGVSRQTLYLWEKGEDISDANRRRIFAVRDVLHRAQKSRPRRAQLIEWLDTPQGIEGVTPAELLARNEVDRARFLAVAMPSSNLLQSPSWVAQRVPEAFQRGAESRQEVLPPEVEDDFDKDE